MSNRPKRTLNAKPGPGRPRKQGDRKAIARARRLLPLAEQRVKAILKDKKSEPRHALRAAELVWRISSQVPAAAPPKSKRMRVEFDEHWTAPTGAESVESDEPEDAAEVEP